MKLIFFFELNLLFPSLALLSPTSFHHISGTRTPHDFVELPSILLEKFAHYPFPCHTMGNPSHSEPLLEPNNNDNPPNPFTEHYTTVLALLDLQYHGFNTMGVSYDSSDMDLINQEPGWSTKTYHDLVRYFSHPFTLDTLHPSDSWQRVRPQTFFTHIHQYGSLYYSYAWGRFWADQIFKKLFIIDPQSCNDKNYLDKIKFGGEIVRNELLKWGGGRDPWIGIENIIGETATEWRKKLQ